MSSWSEDNLLIKEKQKIKKSIDIEYFHAIEQHDMNTAQYLVNEWAKLQGMYKRNAGEEICIYLVDGHKGNTRVSFIDQILDGNKKGETRSNKVNLPIGKWLGMAKGKKVYGRMLLGKPITITNKSPEYALALIEGTEYGLKDGESKKYYPIIDMQDFRDNPRDVVRNGNYGIYQCKSPEVVVFDDDGNIIPLTQRFNVMDSSYY